LQKAYAALNYRRGDFPVAESVAAEIVSLPMFPHLTAQQLATVAEEILVFSSKCSGKPAKSEENSLAFAKITA
jgi:dTDP-4-amino-4,6-dideoxygalactose transaminase